MSEIYSGKGAYIVMRADGSWAFAHDILPDPWFKASGTGLTLNLRPWAKLPNGSLWVPATRAIGHPWRWGKGPDPETALPRDGDGAPLVLSGPVRCEWTRARHEFRLLRGEEAVAAAQAAVRANMLARLLLEGTSPVAVSAFDARIAISSLDWEVLEHEDHVYLVARNGERVLLAGNDWVAGASSIEEALAALEAADQEHGIS